MLGRALLSFTDFLTGDEESLTPNPSASASIKIGEVREYSPLEEVTVGHILSPNREANIMAGSQGKHPDLVHKHSVPAVADVQGNEEETHYPIHPLEDSVNVVALATPVAGCASIVEEHHELLQERLEEQDEDLEVERGPVIFDVTLTPNDRRPSVEAQPSSQGIVLFCEEDEVAVEGDEAEEEGSFEIGENLKEQECCFSEDEVDVSGDYSVMFDDLISGASHHNSNNDELVFTNEGGTLEASDHASQSPMGDDSGPLEEATLALFSGLLEKSASELKLREVQMEALIENNRLLLQQVADMKEREEVATCRKEIQTSTEATQTVDTDETKSAVSHSTCTEGAQTTVRGCVVPQESVSRWRRKVEQFFSAVGMMEVVRPEMSMDDMLDTVLEVALTNRDKPQNTPLPVCSSSIGTQSDSESVSVGSIGCQVCPSVLSVASQCDVLNVEATSSDISCQTSLVCSEVTVQTARDILSVSTQTSLSETKAPAALTTSCGIQTEKEEETDLFPAPAVDLRCTASQCEEDVVVIRLMKRVEDAEANAEEVTRALQQEQRAFEELRAATAVEVRLMNERHTRLTSYLEAVEEKLRKETAQREVVHHLRALSESLATQVNERDGKISSLQLERDGAIKELEELHSLVRHSEAFYESTIEEQVGELEELGATVEGLEETLMATKSDKESLELRANVAETEIEYLRDLLQQKSASLGQVMSEITLQRSATHEMEQEYTQRVATLERQVCDLEDRLFRSHRLSKEADNQVLNAVTQMIDRCRDTSLETTERRRAPSKSKVPHLSSKTPFALPHPL